MAISLQEAILVAPLSSHSYKATIPSYHCYGAGKQMTAHGGLLTSIIQSSIRAHFRTTLARLKQPDTIDLSINFVRPATAGPCTVHLVDVKVGPGVSTLQFRLDQGGKDRLIGFASNSNVDISDGASGVSYATPTIGPSRPVSFAEIQKTGQDSNWISFKIPQNDQSTIKPVTHFTFLTPLQPLAAKNSTEMWMKFANPSEKFTTEMLGSVVDHWHRMPENYVADSKWNYVNIAQRANASPERNVGTWNTVYAYPTLSLHLEIKRALPKEGADWLFVRAESCEIKNGKFDVTVTVLDELGNLVAISHQVCFVLRRAQAVGSKM